MSIVSYMGTKSAIAGKIASSFESLPSGPLLELFAGMSAIGRATAGARSLWTNDVQTFSRLVCEFQFLPCGGEKHLASLVRKALVGYRHNAKVLSEIAADLLAAEHQAVSRGNWQFLCAYEERLRDHTGTMKANWDALFHQQSQLYCLFSDLYAGTYFGLRQCIQIDSLRYGIDLAAPNGDEAKIGRAHV